jgi:phage tail tape-measure protein
MSDKTNPSSGGSHMTDKPKPSSTGSDASEKTNPVGLWERTKTWADQNRTISGALFGGAVGTIVPGVGSLIGSIVGAGVGFASSKEKKEDR